MTPKISVIMGIYNCASTLQEALDSLYAQTYQNFKIILCDDGSTDNTYQVAKAYAEKKTNIVLIRNKINLKLAATLNHCLQYVDTEYVARMDGDDISLPTRFEKELDFLEQNPDFAFVSCPMKYTIKRIVWKIGKAKEIPQINDFRYGPPFCHAPSMMRSSVLYKIGNYTVATKTERIEDFYLWYKFYKNGYKGYNLQEPLYLMEDDINAAKRRKVKDRWRGFLLHCEICKGLNISNPYVFPFINFLKVFIPSKIMLFIRKNILR